MEDRRVDYGRIWHVAKTPIILVALLALIFIAGRWGYAAMTAPLPPPYVEPCIDQPVPDGVLKSEMVTVKVFNASNKRGKATEVSQQLKLQGFQVSSVGNADQNQENSVIIGFATDSPEVELVHQQFQNFERIADGRPDHSVEVRIGQNYQAMVGDAPTEVKINSQTICLPQPQTDAPA
jgi:hypothetical protein